MDHAMQLQATQRNGSNYLDQPISKGHYKQQKEYASNYSTSASRPVLTDLPSFSSSTLSNFSKPQLKQRMSVLQTIESKLLL
jgi:hypothetical protein